MRFFLNDRRSEMKKIVFLMMLAVGVSGFNAQAGFLTWEIIKAMGKEQEKQDKKEKKEKEKKEQKEKEEEEHRKDHHHENDK